MKNASILIAILLLAGCSGMRSSGVTSSGASSASNYGAGGTYGTSSMYVGRTIDPRLPGHVELEGPLSGYWLQ
jgi:hypothetical protein